MFLCLKAKEDVALERSFTQLKQFYADTRYDKQLVLCCLSTAPCHCDNNVTAAY